MESILLSNLTFAHQIREAIIRTKPTIVIILKLFSLKVSTSILKNDPKTLAKIMITRRKSRILIRYLMNLLNIIKALSRRKDKGFFHLWNNFIRVYGQKSKPLRVFAISIFLMFIPI